MADSLVLKGVKDVSKHKGTEMLLLRPKRGGDTHQLKEWWRVNAVSTTYTGCTLFKVTTAGGSVHLALTTGKSEGSEVRIDHDGAFNFSFYHANEIARAALYNESMELIEHYVFPSISGGKIMTVIPPNPASRPGGGGSAPEPDPETSITNVTVTGDQTPEANSTGSYTVAVEGDAAPYTFAWSMTGDGEEATDTNLSVYAVNWGEAGSGTVKCVVSSDDDDFDGNDGEDTLVINVQADSFEVKAAAADYSYVVTTVATNDGNKYYLDGEEQKTISAVVGESIYFDLSDDSMTGHPLQIYTDALKTTKVTVGIEEGDTGLIFTPLAVGSGSFSYQCDLHGNMGGIINVTAATASAPAATPAPAPAPTPAPAPAPTPSPSSSSSYGY